MNYFVKNATCSLLQFLAERQVRLLPSQSRLLSATLVNPAQRIEFSKIFCTTHLAIYLGREDNMVKLFAIIFA